MTGENSTSPKRDIDAIKQLRLLTGVSFKICVEALEESNNDIDSAMEYVKKRADNIVIRASSDCKSGLVGLKCSKDGMSGVMVKVSCDSDFVAKTAAFSNFVSETSVAALSMKCYDVQRLTEIQNEYIKKLMLQTKGSIRIVDVVCLTSKLGKICHYLHECSSDGTTGSIGVLVAVRVGNKGWTSDVRKLVKTIMLQIVGASPQVVSRDQLSADIVKEKYALIRKEIDKKGCSTFNQEKILDGKINQFYSECVLLEQSSVCYPDKTIQEIIQESNLDIFIDNFARLSMINM